MSSIPPSRAKPRAVIAALSEERLEAIRRRLDELTTEIRALLHEQASLKAVQLVAGVTYDPEEQ